MAKETITPASSTNGAHLPRVWFSSLQKELEADPAWLPAFIKRHMRDRHKEQTEYLSLTEHQALLREERAKIWEEAANLFPDGTGQHVNGGSSYVRWQTEVAAHNTLMERAKQLREGK